MPTLENKKIYVAGHLGMVGAAVCRALENEKIGSLITADHSTLDLCDQTATANFIASEKPDVIVLAAAKVGGILANSESPADFAYDNLMIALNVIHSGHKANVERLLFLGSSCIYPKITDQPITEDALLSGKLEPTNEAYAIAKISGVKLCEYYRKQYGALFHSAMPCNLFGLGDNYNPNQCHVIPDLIRRFHEAKVQGAKSVKVWGTGKPRREFLYSEDVATAIIALLKTGNPPSLVNIGAGQDITILELAEKIAQVVEFKGALIFDPEMPDGTLRKLMDSSRIHSLGWKPEIGLEEGLKLTYSEFKKSSL